jgi:hypothetical protein
MCGGEGEWIRESGVSVITSTSHIRRGVPVTMGASWFRRTGSIGMGPCIELDGPSRPEVILAVGMGSWAELDGPAISEGVSAVGMGS